MAGPVMDPASRSHFGGGGVARYNLDAPRRAPPLRRFRQEHPGFTFLVAAAKPAAMRGPAHRVSRAQQNRSDARIRHLCHERFGVDKLVWFAAKAITNGAGTKPVREERNHGLSRSSVCPSHLFHWRGRRAGTVARSEPT